MPPPVIRSGGLPAVFVSVVLFPALASAQEAEPETECHPARPTTIPLTTPWHRTGQEAEEACQALMEEFVRKLEAVNAGPGCQVSSTFSGTEIEVRADPPGRRATCEVDYVVTETVSLTIVGRWSGALRSETFPSGAGGMEDLVLEFASQGDTYRGFRLFRNRNGLQRSPDVSRISVAPGGEVSWVLERPDKFVFTFEGRFTEDGQRITGRYRDNDYFGLGVDRGTFVLTRRAGS